MRWLRQIGWIVDPAERKMGLVSKDWGGFADIIAVAPSGHVWFIQVTSCSNFSSRLKKCRENENAQMLVALGHTVAVWGYDSKLDDLQAQRKQTL